MDIALRGCWHLPPHGLKPLRDMEVAYYKDFCVTAHVLVHCYSDFISGRDFYNAGRRKELVQSGLPHQRAESSSRRVGVVETNVQTLSLIKPRFYFYRRREGRQVA
jgi:hypothetical protein